MDLGMISKIEKGEINISASLVDKLANLFCCPLSSILYGNEDLTCKVDYRSDSITKEDLEALSLINKLVLNQFEMDGITRKSQDPK